MRLRFFLAVLMVAIGSGGVLRAAPAGPRQDPAKGALEDARRAEASNHPQEAIEALKKAYELSGDTNLLFRLGELTHKLGQEIPALRFYRAYLTRDPRGKHHAAAERQVRLLEERASPTSGPGGQGPLKMPGPGWNGPASGHANGPTKMPPVPGAAVGGSVPAGGAAGAWGGNGAVARTQPVPFTPGYPGIAPPEVANDDRGSRGGGAAGGAVVPPALALSTVPPDGGYPTAQIALPPDAAGLPPYEPEPPLPRWLPWTGIAATVGLGAGAILSGISASHRYDELRGSCGATPTGCPKSDVDNLRSRALTTNILWAGAGVMATATGLALYVNTREAGFSGIWRF